MSNSVTIRTSAPGAKQAATDIGRLKASITQMGTGAGGPLGGMLKGLGGMALGAGAAGLAIGKLTDLGGEVSKFLGDSIGLASDFNETVSKSDAVFGGAGEDIREWAEGAAHDFGLSQTAALDAATTFGGLFKTVGQSADEAGDHAKEMTELGADLASFFNTDMKTALDSLRSGLAGEAEPMRKFNVFISEAAVNTKLLEQGQKKVNGSWTESQKIMGRYAIIMDQTADAHGDFAKTQDGLANATREFDAAISDLKVDIGEDFLDMMKEGAGGAIDFTYALQGLTDVIEAGLGIEKLGADNPIFNLGGLADQLADQLPPALADMMRQVGQDQRLKSAADEMNRKIFEVRNLPTELITNGLSEAIHGANSKELGGDMADLVGKAWTTAEDRIGTYLRPAGANIMDDLASGIKGNKDAVDEAMDEITYAINHPMKMAAEVARINGALTSQKLGDALASKNPYIRAVAQQQAEILKDKYQQMTGQAWQGGASAGNAWVNGFEFGFGGGPSGGIGSKLGGKKPPKKKQPAKSGKVLDGGRAGGGPVAAGGAYLVGENGPEVLQMGGRSGRVLPNGGSTNIHISLSTREFSHHSAHFATIQRGGPSFT